VPGCYKNDGGRLAAIPVRTVWCADAEYQSVNGSVFTLCMVFKELYTGEIRRLWRDELIRLKKAPIDTGSDALFVAYLASAELRCFLELGWPLPHNVLDLFVEHRVLTNGRRLLTGDSLLGASALRGLPHISSVQKDAMYKLICEPGDKTPTQRQAILDYCESDVDALVALVHAMAGEIDWDRAVKSRGRYMKSVARMEETGISIDTTMHRLFVHEWDRIKTKLVGHVDRHYGVYEGLTFKASRFSRLLAANNISWPRLPSGALDLKDDTFKEQAALWPGLSLLRELRQTLARMPLSKLEVGDDGRSRCMLSPFHSLTGRNQPSGSRFAFGPAKWTPGSNQAAAWLRQGLH
jgi:DNA polymerase-1